MKEIYETNIKNYENIIGMIDAGYKPETIRKAVSIILNHEKSYLEFLKNKKVDVKYV
jgi:hypothetical protein